jgi:L-threonylcarbamoyladenylate synthase
LHVHQSFADKDLLILDGGRCSVGIESTIVDATHQEYMQVLRHGVVNEERIRQVIHTEIGVSEERAIRVSGQLDSHYQPDKTLYYFDDVALLDEFCQERSGDVFVMAMTKPASIKQEFFFPLDEQPETVAYNLYYHLRQADQSVATCIAIELPPATNHWLGVRERILKAGIPDVK